MNSRRFHYAAQCANEKETALREIIFQIAAAPYVTVPLASHVTGLTEKAIRRKIEDGKWIDGREYRRSPDGGIFISLKGYQEWVEKVMA